ncbi:hypothetical protein [Oscillibacter ruminantium]|uniref:hypothetical protein n=1 Tax=Oscillibacter ruminantium TaxID=1263547 RepID=UPI00058BDA29|nr:hypothetical protein [Oscillibacter ruminantium]
MERLTHYDINGRVYSTRGYEITLSMLAAYEDTGLEPDEIGDLRASADGLAMLVRQVSCDCSITFTHLRELAEADKDGRLVVLPCKVEQLRKMLDDLTSGSSVDAGETYTTGYRYGWENGRAELLRYIFGMSDGGTREAAEAALRGEEITDCDKCDIWSEDGENCGWTHDGKDFVCVRGHILTAKEKQSALRKSSELRKHDEAALGKDEDQ